jgi:hypothetical protein
VYWINTVFHHSCLCLLMVTWLRDLNANVIWIFLSRLGRLSHCMIWMPSCFCCANSSEVDTDGMLF